MSISNITVPLSDSEEHSTPDLENSEERPQVRRLQRYIEDLLQMKNEEAEDGISDGRKRWFNEEIRKSREKISELKESE